MQFALPTVALVIADLDLALGAGRAVVRFLAAGHTTPVDAVAVLGVESAVQVLATRRTEVGLGRAGHLARQADLLTAAALQLLALVAQGAVVIEDAAARTDLLVRARTAGADALAAGTIPITTAGRAELDRGAANPYGIAMTDEEDIGLFMKRAKAAELTLGDGIYHRDRFARATGF